MSFDVAHGRAKNTSMIAGRGWRRPAPLVRSTVAGVLALGLVAGLAGPSFAALPSGDITGQGVLGSRPGATRLPVSVTDQVGLSVDVGTGNVMLNLAGLAAPGVTSDVGVGLVGNSLPGPAAAASALPKGFGFNVGGAGRLATVTGGVMWTAGDGYSVIFAPVTGRVK